LLDLQGLIPLAEISAVPGRGPREH
jgi:hypothetical protein